MTRASNGSGDSRTYQRAITTARTALHRVGGPSAFDTRVIASTAILLFSMPLVTAFVRGDDLARWAVASAIAVAAMLSVAVAIRVTLLPARPRSSRAVVAFIAFAVCGLTRDAMFSVAVDWVGVSTPPRSSGLLALTVIYMTLAALNASHVSDARLAVSSLAAEVHRLDQLVGTFDDRVAQADREIAEYVRAELDPAMSQIEATLLQETPEDMTLQEEAHLLTSTVSNIVRPMSHRLMNTSPAQVNEWSNVAPFEVVTHESHLDSTRRKWWRQSVNTPAAIRPILTTLLMIVLIRVPRLTGPDGLVLEQLITVAIIIYALPAVLLVAMRRWWPDRLRYLPLPVSLALLLLAYATAAALPIVAAKALNSAEQTPFLNLTGSLGVPPTVLLEIVMGMAISLMTLGRMRLVDIQAKLEQTSSQLELTVSRLRKLLWIQRRNLSWILHGPIQSALISAALALTSADARVDREQIRQRIETAIKAIETNGPTHQNLSFALTEIVNVWSYSCAVTFQVNPVLVDELNHDMTTTIALAEIVREAVGNAIRHGHATAVNVEVDYMGPAIVRVVVIDNGHGTDPEATPGLGTQILDQVTYNWDLTSTPTGSTLTADLALSGESNSAGRDNEK